MAPSHGGKKRGGRKQTKKAAAEAEGAATAADQQQQQQEGGQEQQQQLEDEEMSAPQQHQQESQAEQKEEPAPAAAAAASADQQQPEETAAAAAAATGANEPEAASSAAPAAFSASMEGSYADETQLQDFEISKPSAPPADAPVAAAAPAESPKVGDASKEKSEEAKIEEVKQEEAILSSPVPMADEPIVLVPPTSEPEVEPAAGDAPLLDLSRKPEPTQSSKPFRFQIPSSPQQETWDKSAEEEKRPESAATAQQGDEERGEESAAAASSDAFAAAVDSPRPGLNLFGSPVPRGEPGSGSSGGMGSGGGGGRKLTLPAAKRGGAGAAHAPRLITASPRIHRSPKQQAFEQQPPRQSRMQPLQQAMRPAGPARGQQSSYPPQQQQQSMMVSATMQDLIARGAFDYLKDGSGNFLPSVQQTLELFDPNVNYFQSTPPIEQAQTTDEAREIIMGMLAALQADVHRISSELMSGVFTALDQFKQKCIEKTERFAESGAETARLQEGMAAAQAEVDRMMNALGGPAAIGLQEEEDQRNM